MEVVVDEFDHDQITTRKTTLGVAFTENGPQKIKRGFKMPNGLPKKRDVPFEKLGREIEFDAWAQVKRRPFRSLGREMKLDAWAQENRRPCMRKRDLTRASK